MDAFQARIVLEGGSWQPSNTLDRTRPLPFPKFIHGGPIGQGDRRSGATSAVFLHNFTIYLHFVNFLKHRNLNLILSPIILVLILKI